MAEAISVEVVVRDHPDSGDAELCILGAFEGEAPEADGLDEGCRQAVERLAGRPGWKGREDQAAQTDLAGGPVVALSGLGKRDELTAAKLAAWIGSTAERARINGFQA
jgi:hypothetical protein